MLMELALGLFLISAAAVFGGILAKYLKAPALVGYILAGIFFGAVLPQNVKNVSGLAEIGTILLLFSIGIELSLSRLSKFLIPGVSSAILQIILTTLAGFFILTKIGFGFDSALVLSLGFSISSTAVLVMILGNLGEMETIHGNLMFAWSLVQDLAAIPIIAVLPIIARDGGGIFGALSISLLKTFAVIASALILGKLVIPTVLKFVASANSRELLLFTSVALAIGTALATSFFGISAALGAFLAGVVISESQERHAVFAETRPLRDLFVALFFVTLGFMVNIPVIWSNLFLIIFITVITIILKTIVIFVLSILFNYKGKTAIATSFGLAQVGEFAFVIFSSALSLRLINERDVSFGISVTLLSLVLAPILYSRTVPFWRRLKKAAGTSKILSKLFAAGEKRDFSEGLEGHIIICGYGRVGKWVGRALTDFGIPFIVIEYNQKVVNELKNLGIGVIYGDPTEPEVLEAVGIRGARAVILAIPDRVAQENLIAYTQSVAPGVKIISRVHLDEDWEKLKNLRVDKLVQPEFEAAIEIVKSVLISRGKTKEEIRGAIKSLRVSHSK